MKRPTINKHRTYLIIPFTYLKAYKLIQSVPFFNEKKISKDKVYDHVAKLISNDSGESSAIGKAYCLDANNRRKVGLPNKADDKITYQVKDQSFEIQIRHIDMYLFDTQVGFLVYDIQSCGIIDGLKDELTIHDLVQTNYHLKKFFFTGNTMVYKRKISRDETEEMTVSLEQLTKRFTETIIVGSYFDEDDTKPNHSLLFTAVSLKKPETDENVDVAKYLYYLRRSFRDSYLPAEQDLTVSNNREIYQPFENSFWGVSVEGAANIVLETGDPKTDAFFENTFFSNIERTYFYLYILLLYQKYSLLKISVNAASVHTELKGKDFTEQVDIVQSFKQKFIDFTVRGYYEQVSYITHHAELYNKMKDRLGIRDLHNEIHSEFEALSSFIEVAADKQQKQRDDENAALKERNNMLIQLITFLFLPVTVVSGLFGMNEVGIMSGLGTKGFFWMLGVVYIFSVVVLYLFRPRKFR